MPLVTQVPDARPRQQQDAAYVFVYRGTSRAMPEAVAGELPAHDRADELRIFVAEHGFCYRALHGVLVRDVLFSVGHDDEIRRVEVAISIGLLLERASDVFLGRDYPASQTPDPDGAPDRTGRGFSWGARVQLKFDTPSSNGEHSDHFALPCRFDIVARPLFNRRDERCERWTFRACIH
jgi:hypothetical protein